VMQNLCPDLVSACHNQFKMFIVFHIFITLQDSGMNTSKFSTLIKLVRSIGL
jgi:hypothetical protein